MHGMTLLTATQTAERLGISVRTLDRMEGDGRLRPATRTRGGHRRYDAGEVERVFAGADQEPHPVAS